MALIKYGGGIVQMSGSVAGNTHARNRFGNYMRARTKPVNPKSDRQNHARAIIMQLAEQWRGAPMDDAIRTAWQTYADSCSWLNKLGESVKLTGFNMFVQGNAAKIATGGPLVTAAPAALGLPPGDPEFEITTLSAGGQDASILFSDGWDWGKEDFGLLMVYMGQPQPASHNFFAGPWRYWDSVDGIAVSPPTSPQDNIGSLPYTAVLGQKVWFEARIVRADARTSTRFRCAPVIVEA